MFEMIYKLTNLSHFIVFYSFILLTLCCRNCYGHPQCLDFGPPFRGKNTLSLCAEYQDFGCCTKEKDNDLLSMLNVIRDRTPDEILSRCETYIRELLCQECSPYAAHIYDSEAKLHSKTFPGTCIPFCRQLLTGCRMVVQSLVSLYNDTDLSVKLQEGDESFCQYVALKDEDYCYPDLKTNEILNKDVTPGRKSSKGCLCVEKFAEGFGAPLFAKNAGDDSERLFIGEKGGKIYVHFLNGTKVEQPFLDVEDLIVMDSANDEKGLLSMAFHPQNVTNGRFFISYSRKSVVEKGEQLKVDHVLRVSEFQVSQENEQQANKSHERVIIGIDQPYGNHNGGDMLFGDDGYLYIFVGDGGSAGDPDGYPQRRSTWIGKVLRVNVDVHGQVGYSIPDDNPFINDPRFLPEIYAYGLRNPWRCGKDKGDPNTGEGKGRILCGDVGQGANEEIDLIVKGGNYGWNSREGLECYKKDICGKISKEELPVHTYSHSEGKCVIGGHFYRGCINPNLNGWYIYGDLHTGLTASMSIVDEKKLHENLYHSFCKRSIFDRRLYRLVQDEISNTWVNREITMCGNELCTSPLTNQFPLPHILAFGEDEYGEIYILSTSDWSFESKAGGVYKIVDPTRRGDPDECKTERINPTDNSFSYNTIQNKGCQFGVSTMSFVIHSVCIFLLTAYAM